MHSMACISSREYLTLVSYHYYVISVLHRNMHFMKPIFVQYDLLYEYEEKGHDEGMLHRVEY